jgi:hypothetical protein
MNLALETAATPKVCSSSLEIQLFDHLKYKVGKKVQF